MYNHILFLSYWIVNVVVLFLLSVILGNNLVLGNWKYTQLEAAFFASFWLTFFVWSMWDFLIVRDVKFDDRITNFILFSVVNIVGIWLVARFPHLTGMGISSFVVAILIGITINLVQRSIFKMVTKSRLS